MSTIRIECKSCDARYKVPADIEKPALKCKRCGATMRVPGRTRATAREETGSTERPARETTTGSMRLTSSGRSRNITVTGISTRKKRAGLNSTALMAVVAVVVIAGAAWIMVH